MMSDLMPVSSTELPPSDDNSPIDTDQIANDVEAHNLNDVFDDESDINMPIVTASSVLTSSSQQSSMSSNSLWGKIRARFFADEIDRQYRLRQLNAAIELYPQVPVNYLLRAEYFLEDQRYHLAQDDFQQTLRLARKEMVRRQWGITEQIIIDRAEYGLRYVQRFVLTERVHKEE